MDNVLVSVVVPLYNSEKYLIQCIESLEKQSLKDMEIILVNDGSTDNTGDLCEKVKNRYNNIRVFFQKNLGVSAARNLGIEKAKGKWITFVDSDDEISDKTLEVAMKLGEIYNAGIVSYRMMIESDHKSENVEKEIVLDSIYSRLEAFFNGEIDGSACTKIFRLKDLGNLRFDTRLKVNEDKLFVYKALLQMQKIVVTEYRFYNYFLNDSSATHTYGYDQWLDMIHVADYICEDIKLKCPDLFGKAERHRAGVLVMLYRTGLKAPKINIKELRKIRKLIKKIELTKLDMKEQTFEKNFSLILIRYLPGVYIGLYLAFFKSPLYRAHKKRAYSRRS